MGHSKAIFAPRELPPLRPFHFMELAKRLENAPGWFLAGSTMAAPSADEVGWTDQDFGLTSLPGSYGDVRSIDAIVSRFGVSPENVVMTGGASEGNALVYQALLQPGDEVLAETPGYQSFHLLPQLHGATVRLLPRREENGFNPDPDEVRRLLKPETRLLVLTNLHNPTMALMPPEVLREVLMAARERGVWVLVDEIYLDHLKPGAADPTCFHYSDNVIVTSSMTKVYGVGVLRCGWVLAPKNIADRLLEIIDLTTVIQPGIAQNLGARLLMNADRLRPRARIRHERGMAILKAWAAGRGDITVFDAPGGITAAVKVNGLRDSGELCDFLVRHHSVLVAPGTAFQMPEWLRINIAGEPDWLRQALAALGRGLDDWRDREAAAGRGQHA